MSRTFMDIMYELDEIKRERDEKIFNEVVANEWIPCSERLPECNGRYLVTNEAWGANEIEINVWEHGWYYNTKPIAWMPLPAPYSIKSDGISEEE